MDLSDPSEPAHASTFKIPESVRIGSLLLDEDTVITSHYETILSEGKVRFFMDRIDFSDPNDPQITQKINIPGSLVGYSSDSMTAVTVDYKLKSFRPTDDHGCWGYSYYDVIYNDELEMCYRIERSLNILKISANVAIREKELEFNDMYLGSVKLTESNVFVVTQPNNYYSYYEEGDNTDPRAELSVIPLKNNPDFDITSTVKLDNPYSWLGGAAGNRAIVVSDYPPSISIYLTGDNDSLNIEKQERLTGYSYDLHIFDHEILTANSMWGVQSIKY